MLEKFKLNYSEKTDIIELDEIIHTLKKQKRAVIWTTYYRLQKRVMAYHIGEDKPAVK